MLGSVKATTRKEQHMKALKLKIAGGAAALAAVIGGGAAVAATQLTPSEESDAIVEDAAKQLGVSAEKLDAALKQALENRVDAAVEAGTLTEAQGVELKERIEAGEVPLIGIGPGGAHRGHHRFVDFAAAADFLGITEAKLRSSLEGGDTLAEIATANGKTAAGLVDALVASAKADLAEKVAEGRLTDAQRDSIVADLEERMQDVVDGEFSFGFRGSHPGPPPADAPSHSSSGSDA
jgi:hypothetical protein